MSTTREVASGNGGGWVLLWLLMMSEWKEGESCGCGQCEYRRVVCLAWPGGDWTGRDCVLIATHADFDEYISHHPELVLQHACTLEVQRVTSLTEDYVHR